jgi:hypothetical protein
LKLAQLARDTWMRISIALLTILTTTASANTVNACCLTDWLFGRTATPYAAGYAPYGYAAPVGVPVTGSTYAAGYAPYTAGYAPYAGYSVPTYAPSTSVLGPTFTTNPLVNNGAYQVQRPTYIDNPNVYTGQPTTSLRGVAPGSSYLGAANQYPTYQASYAGSYVSGYSNPTSPGLPLSVTTPQGAPAAQWPATQVAPIYAPTQSTGGLGRFFGSMFGTNYASSYYRAPVTYYRPVTSVDPVTGTTVTVQQPCSSYVQQLQRSPYSSFQIGQPTVLPQSTCQTVPTTGYSPYGQYEPYAPSSYAGVSPQGVGQVSAIGTADQQLTVPIPSTAPAAGYYGQYEYAPNTTPLTGTPGGLAPAAFPPAAAPSFEQAPRSTNPNVGGEDLSPVDEPRIESNRPAETDIKIEPPRTNSGGSYWKLQEADDSTALIPRQDEARNDLKAPANDPVSLSPNDYTDATPIQAPDDYVSPFRKELMEAAKAEGKPVWSNESRLPRPSLEAPPLPARSDFDAPDATSVSNRQSVPVRDAGLVRGRTTPRAVAKPTPVKRDSEWNPVR